MLANLLFQPLGESNLDSGSESSEQTVEAEESTIHIDRVGRASLPLHRPEMIGFPVLFSHIVDRLQEPWITEVEGAGAEG